MNFKLGHYLLNTCDYVWNWYYVLPDVSILIGPVSDYSESKAIKAGMEMHQHRRKSRLFGTMEGHYVQ